MVVPSLSSLRHDAPPAPLGRSCRNYSFVHIPKTGGTTINQILKRDRILASRRNRFDGMDGLGHDSAAHQRARLGADRWDRSYTFSIVRDPYDWAISQFFYHLQQHCTRAEKKKPCENATALSRRPVTDPMYRAVFSEWLVWLDGNAMDGVGAISGVRHDERNASRVSQKAWLTDQSGAFLVEHVFKLGSTEYERAATCQGLHETLCDAEVRPRLRCANDTRQAAVVKPTRHGTRRDYFTAATCAVVAKWFSEDFEAFGFNASACP